MTEESTYTEPEIVDAVDAVDGSPTIREQYPNLTMTATYSPEDNKLRLSASARLPKELYEKVKAHGFKWAPKQEIFVAPSWSPQREDFLIELCGEIDDEDYSPTERAADRAERFGEYRDKRRAEAGGHADRFESGPTAFGHQNRARAERQAARHDRHRGRALSQWSKAEYWQSRTEGVISHALYLASPAVLRGRILRLETEQRKHNENRNDYAKRFGMWQKVATLDGANEPIPQESYQPWQDRPEITSKRLTPTTPAAKFAYVLANTGGYWGKYKHPRTGEENSILELLSHLADPITPAEAAALWLADRVDPDTPGTYSARWSEHYANRLAYERAMLAAEGGSVDEADMEPGGWILTSNRTGSVFTEVSKGWKQIHAVTRSPKTKRVTSVKVMGLVGYRDPKLGLVSVNIQRLGSDHYRPPTEEERETFKAETKERKAKAKAEKPEAIPLINPTDADAEKLQKIWNERAAEHHRAAKAYGEPKAVEVLRLTQAEYSDRSKGGYGTCETSEVSERLKIRSKYYGGDRDRETVFKVRTGTPGGYSYAARRVIILTDKPQKPIPWLSVDAARAKYPTERWVRDRMGFLHQVIIGGQPGANYRTAPEDGTDEAKILEAAVYVGWASRPSQSQFHFTKRGAEEYQKWKADQEAAGTDFSAVRYSLHGEHYTGAPAGVS